MTFQCSGRGIVTINNATIGNVLKMSLSGAINTKSKKAFSGGITEQLLRLSSLRVSLTCGEYVPDLLALALWGTNTAGVISIGATQSATYDLKFTGVNAYNPDTSLIVHLPRVEFDFIGELPIIDEELSEFSLLGTVIKDNTNLTTPYGTITLA